MKLQSMRGEEWPHGNRDELSGSGKLPDDSYLLRWQNLTRPAKHTMTGNDWHETLVGARLKGDRIVSVCAWQTMIAHMLPTDSQRDRLVKTFC